MNDKIHTWCAACGARFTANETEDATCCPKCKNPGVPCDPDSDYKIEINWHELRILGIWATHYANEHCDHYSRQTLRGIITRLERQKPDEPPLTLAGEIRELRKNVNVGKVETNIPLEGVVPVNGPGAVGHSK